MVEHHEKRTIADIWSVCDGSWPHRILNILYWLLYVLLANLIVNNLLVISSHTVVFPIG